MKAWVFLQTDTDSFSGNEGYSDEIGVKYNWNSTVHNHAKPQEGDFIIIRGSKHTFGSSIISNLDMSEGTAIRNRCPKCDHTSFSTRKTISPPHRCEKCKHEFHKPKKETLDVTNYTAYYEENWVEQEVESVRLEGLYINKNRMYSLRDIELDPVLILFGRDPGGMAKGTGGTTVPVPRKMRKTKHERRSSGTS
jgi:putative restriction endonuclease